MSNDIQRYEQHIYDVVRAIHDEYDTSLNARGISYRIGITRRYDDNNQYMSEIETVYYRAGDINDVIEFFIYWHDDIALDEDVLIIDLRKEIEGMLILKT